MAYELTIAWRTIRKEGLGALFSKFFLYLSQLGHGMAFLLSRKPSAMTPAQAVDFSFNVGGGFICPGQIRSEYLQIAQLIHEKQPKVIVEIGTANGGTLFGWCSLAHPQAHLISIDLPGGIHGGGYPAWKGLVYKRFRQPGQSLELLRADSHLSETRSRLEECLHGERIDFLFIDGDHTYDGVKADFEMYSPLVKPGGLVAFHDVCVHPAEMDCHVDRFWNEIRRTRESWEYIENPNQGGYGIGVLRF